MAWTRAAFAAVSIAALLALTAAGAGADQTDAGLDELFQVLKTTADPRDAMAAEQAIWRIWLESGREDIDDLMDEGILAITDGRIDDAITIFTRIVERAPGFAEGWNKRATAYYLNEDYVASVEDIRRTLALEPRHFGAISGMGLIFLARGDDAGALNAFEAVLAIHPHDSGARAQVEALRERLGERGA
jgi:tetratricopeptide (TPR) repeat protein